MADFYIDHGCTLYPSLYMSVPASAASLPQEGDGKASGTGTAPASSSASINLTGVTAAAGATISVMGAALTCVASGAGTTQFNAGSGSTLATNLATAINAATASPTTTTGGISSPYLKALVWAVASGATLTVHSRIASADLNQSANASCIIACGTLGSWTSPPANANFSGGVSGPWSHFFNTAALTAGINASILTQGTYGSVVATMMGLPAAGDTINVRTERSGSPIVMDLTTLAYTVNMRNVGTINNYLRILFDKGVVWPGQSNVFTITKSGAGGIATINVLGYTHVKGQTLDGSLATEGGVPNFKLNYTATDSSGYSITFNVGSSHNSKHTVVEGLETYDAGNGTFTSTDVRVSFSGIADANKPALFISCKFGHMNRSGAGSVFFSNSSSGGYFEAIDCLLAFGGATTHSAAILSAGSTSAHGVRLIRPKFTGGGGGHHTLVPNTSVYPMVLMIEDPVDMGQFIPSDSSASFCGSSTGSSGILAGVQDFGIGQFLTSNAAGRAFLLDTPRRLLEWRPAGFPTTARSSLPDGTPFSVRFSVASSANYPGAINYWNPVRGIKQIDTNTFGDQASLVLTHNFLLDTLFGGSAYTPTDAEWWIEGSYVSSVDGSTKMFSTRGSGTNLSVGTEDWSSYSFAPFAGGARAYNRWKITTTLTDVEADTDVTLYLMCAKQASTTAEWCFIDPQFVLALP